MTRRLATVPLLLLPIWLACTPSAGPRERQVLIEGLPDERARLEGERQRSPSSIDARIELGEAYYRTAREFLDLERDEEGYLNFLALSVDEFVGAVELDPADNRPHFYLAMMDVYQGDLDKALRGFENALSLQPSGVGYTNLAEIFVYMNQLSKAQTWNEKGLRNGAPQSALLFNDMLIAWRQNDLGEAERIFEQLRDRYPEAIGTINVARLPHPPSRFKTFASYCCRSPACGPYMRDPCQSLGLTVEDRELSAAAALKQLRIEMEKTRRMKEVYRQHKELEVKIEGAAPAGP